MTRDSGSERAIVVSNDTHIGPRLVEDLREYCPSSHLEEFDRFAATTATARAAAEKMLRGVGTSITRTCRRSVITIPRRGWPTTTTTASPQA